jgi:5'-3' exonuclease
VSTAVLVDANNILRSAMAVRMDSDLASHGVPTGPVTIFINRLSRYVRELRPHRLLVAWDSSGPNRRTQLLATYKANRKVAPTEERERRESHFVLAKEFCAAAGVHQTALPGYEADDIIAGGWRTLTPENGITKIVIVSNDTDFFQLLGQNPHGVEVEQVRLSPKQSSLDVLTSSRICAESGVTHPSDLGRVKVLTGDTSDNVLGLRGIGPVRAKKLLAENLWDLGEIARVHPEYRETIELNQQLIDLRMSGLTIQVPLWEPTSQTSLAYPALVDFLHRYELRGALDRVTAGTLWVGDNAELPTIGRRLKLGGSRG